MTDVPEIAQFARNFAVMVRVQGPDPKGLKMRGHAFHLHQSGTTTLSASGILLPPGCLTDPPPILDSVCSAHGHSGAVVVTAASVLEPFLIAQQRNRPTREFSPKLIADARIDVLVEGSKNAGGEDAPPSWVSCQLLALVGVTASASALLSLVGAHTGLPEHASWEAGWSLSPLYNDPQSGMDVSRRKVNNDNMHLLDDSSNLTLMSKLATKIAFLGVSVDDLKEILHINISLTKEIGALLLVIGSPFGVLSPLHFYNSICVGSVANCFSQGSCNSSLLMADIRCLPGMEGSPVFDKHACLTGMLTRPLRQKGSGTEIQLLITWDAIATAWNNDLIKEVQSAEGELSDRNVNSRQTASLNSCSSSWRSVKLSPEASQPSLAKAMSSVVLITVGDGVWASGIVLNNKGLVLTNAHILEPWRFGRPPLLGLMEKTRTLSVEHGRPLPEQSDEGADEKGTKASLLDLNYRSYRKISVRLDHVDPKVWCDARVVYVSNGPLDIALLQLISFEVELCAITPEFSFPPEGSTVHVIGHGLLGPRSDAHPSFSSGILSSVVRIPRSLNLDGSSMMEADKKYMPIMLQTTAAVHPGASGGAVLNSDGHMIGLITSNAKHSGGTIIPHMNFSIPCRALEPIFKFSEKHDMSILQYLNKPNELLSSIWALVQPSSPLQQQPPDINNKDGRGSRFSKFLSEKRTDLSSLADREHLIKERLPSKI